jgi:rubrerythrin
MNEDLTQKAPVIKSLPSLLDFGKKMNPSIGPTNSGPYSNETEELFYTCPQCGHAMVTKKCKIVCYHCHYFIGCVE